METVKLFWLIGVAAIVAVFYFFLLPRFKMEQRSGILFRAILFFAMIGYLAYDFYMREKYGYIIMLAAGSIAFIFVLRSYRKKD
jgi:hypothetical protein